MRAFDARAPGKVNLCLYLGAVRPDGLHALVSLVQSVSLSDDLRLEPAGPDARADEVLCAGVEGENLAARALELYRSETGWEGEPVRLTIVKRVPVAGGMGGGSADAAAALRLANAAAGRGDDAERALRLAPRLGADVAAQVRPGLALVTGAGEAVRPLAPFDPFGIVIVPSVHRLATRDVFAEADRLRLARPAEELEERMAAVRAAAAGGELPADLISNDLEPAARSLCPDIEPVLDAVSEAGADRVLVSGSGPTVAGLFLGPQGPGAAERAAARLSSRFEGAVAVRPVEAGHGAPRSVDG